MEQLLADVAAFRAAMGLPIGDKPRLPHQIDHRLHVGLLQEELDELNQAAQSNDLVETFDGLLDLIYVACGTILDLGLGELAQTGWNEVQRSNMSKTVTSEAEGVISQNGYYLKGITSELLPVGNRWVLRRSSDGKVLKPYTYSAPDLATILPEPL
ncbi:phosphoribosyl-ATP pyrophosphohydrolase [Spirosoma oryzae]|uniref:Phosphoribosyl-ATP pyrophosphohydrolase n=1 Tax=Spirosoma oryzae TaxID=1469603 RepID=A0A2T0SYK4_9BACT|nr:nucleoside triphosphate pyrophosphohydrolase family protein [Spirosoma oryzae]PRY38484.1 phosphoribosyl-ATP pyrophosphohydrolase [Spirosoma oryzae]